MGLALSLAAGSFILRFRETPSSAGDRLIVAATLPLLAGLAERIGGREVEVAAVVPGGICAHDYEPGPGQFARLAGAALFIKAGAGLDPWADAFLAGLGGRRPLLVDASSGVPAAGRDGAGVHYWWDPEGAARAAGNILEALCALRPGRSAFFRRNYRSFRAELQKTAAALRVETASLRRRELVSYSAAFSLLFACFGFDNLATVEEAHEEEAPAQRLVEAARIIRGRRVRVVVGEATNPRPAEVLAAETGARLVLLWPATDETGDYLHTLRRNVSLLCGGFR